MNRGSKICLRLRFPSDRTLFLPLVQVVDTMLHELAHIVHGPHNQPFHALWDQLRDECQSLMLKGYTGEGFLSEGRRLGGSRMPDREIRRLAAEAAQKRSGRRLGGVAPRQGEDMRSVIAAAAERRVAVLRGCGTDKLDEKEIEEISDAAAKNGFRTQAEEDEANEAAIAQALWEMVQEDERGKNGTRYTPSTAARPQETSPSDADPISWVCAACTLHNPWQFLCCDACGTEKLDGLKRQRDSDGPLGATQVVDLTVSPVKKKR